MAGKAIDDIWEYFTKLCNYLNCLCNIIFLKKCYSDEVCRTTINLGVNILINSTREQPFFLATGPIFYPTSNECAKITPL